MSFDSLLVTSGFFWTLAYLLIICQGYRDKTYGMPLVALCANLSWEFVFSVIAPHSAPQIYVNVIWLGFDVVIAVQLLRYGPQEWNLKPTFFYGLFAISLSAALPAIYFICLEFSELDQWSGAYAAFGQNLMMSILFLELLRSRGDLRGQSIGIATCKLVGTFFASLGFYLHTIVGQSPLLIYLFVAIFFFDAGYLALVIAKRINPQFSLRQKREEQCS